MDAGDAHVREVFFDVHQGLPREGPGDRASTARALALTGPPCPAPAVLDIGCGPGAQTLDLAGLLPEARIVALDRHEPFLHEARRRATAHGAGGRVRIVGADMAAMPFAEASFDLLWCEGAAYNLGLEIALRAWRPLMRPGGRLALTEAVWLCSDPPAPVRRFWADAYPAMIDVAGCRAIARAAGYGLLGDFVLPQAAWWEPYYEPMARRIEEVAAQRAGDPVAAEVLASCRAEIELYRAHADCYGYVFLVLAP